MIPPRERRERMRGGRDVVGCGKLKEAENPIQKREVGQRDLPSFLSLSPLSLFRWCARMHLKLQVAGTHPRCTKLKIP